MRVAVTGASGYVGGIILKSFRNHGIETTALSRRKVDAPWIPYSLGMDPSLLPLGKFDTLVHAAYDFGCNGSRMILEKNVKTSIRLFETAASSGVGRLIFISSMSSYAGCRSLYGMAKYRIEQTVIKLGGVVIRPGLVWGDNAGGVMGSLVKMTKKIPVVPVLSGYHEPKQYLVHEEDLGKCVVQASREKKSGITYTATYPKPVRIGRIIRIIESRLGVQRLHIPIPWPFVYMILKTGETLGLTLPFRSDSLLGLVYSAPGIEFNESPEGVGYRPFG